MLPSHISALLIPLSDPSCCPCGPSCVQAEQLKVTDVVVLIDREQGGPQHLAKNGLRLHSAFTLSALLKVCALGRLQQSTDMGAARGMVGGFRKMHS